MSTLWMSLALILISPIGVALLLLTYGGITALRDWFRDRAHDRRRARQQRARYCGRCGRRTINDASRESGTYRWVTPPCRLCGRGVAYADPCPEHQRRWLITEHERRRRWAMEEGPLVKGARA